MTDYPTVSFMTYDWAFGRQPLEPNGCAWYRCMLPMFELRKHGWDSAIGMPGWNDKHGYGLLLPDERAVHGWDIIVFKLIMMESVALKMDIAKSMGQKIVVDIDDWFEGLEKSNLAHRITDATTNPTNNREHYATIIEKADAIITSTPFLYDRYIEKGHKNVFLVRNGIDIDRWTPRKDHSRWLPTVGWVGATPWRSKDLQILDPVMNNFLEKNHLHFHHSGHVHGSAYAWNQLGLYKDKKHTHQGMEPISNYPSMFRKIDIGIVPLNDVPFNEAKSFIKGLEYAAAGVPFIASATSEYKILEESGVGVTASNNIEWKTYLEAMVDPAIRAQEREKNLENIKQHTMEIRGHDWNEVMHKILEL